MNLPSEEDLPGAMTMSFFPERNAMPTFAAACTPQREPQEKSLTPLAHEWLAKLPPRYQPFVTARLHPHIVNRLSASWHLPSQLSGYFQGLLLATRKGRAGFSLGVLTEITDLYGLVAGSAPSGPALGASNSGASTSAYASTRQNATACERIPDQRR